MITSDDMQMLWLFAALSVVAIWAFAIWSFFKMIELEKRFQVRYDVDQDSGLIRSKHGATASNDDRLLPGDFSIPAQKLMNVLKSKECLDAMDATIRETVKRKP